MSQPPEAEVFDLRKLLEQRGLSPGFCPVPFTSLMFEADGAVGCCRMKGASHAVGDIKRDSIEEIWNGEKIRQWRRDFLSGQNRICANEIRHRSCNLYIASFDLLKNAALAEVQPDLPQRIGLNLNGQCNQACPMCEVRFKPSGLYDEPELRKLVEERLLPRAREVEMLSGEPFIQKDTYRFFEISSRLNPDCEWNITTNAHWRLTDGLRAALNRLRFKRLTISLDSLAPEVYAKIRKNGSLSRAVNTVLALRDYDLDRRARGMSGLNLDINCTVQRDNWRELPGIFEFCERNGIPARTSLLYQPECFSILSMSLKDREQILEYFVSALSVRRLAQLGAVIRPILESVSPIARMGTWGIIEEKMRLQRRDEAVDERDAELLRHLYFSEPEAFLSKDAWRFRLKALDLKIATEQDFESVNESQSVLLIRGKPMVGLDCLRLAGESKLGVLFEAFVDRKEFLVKLRVNVPMLLELESWCSFLDRTGLPYELVLEQQEHESLFSLKTLDRVTLERLIERVRHKSSKSVDEALLQLRSHALDSEILGNVDHWAVKGAFSLRKLIEQGGVGELDWFFRSKEIEKWRDAILSELPEGQWLRFHLEYASGRGVFLWDINESENSLLEKLKKRARSDGPLLVCFTHSFRRLREPMVFLRELHSFLPAESRLSVIDAAVTPLNRLLNASRKDRVFSRVIGPEGSGKENLATVWNIFEAPRLKSRLDLPGFALRLGRAIPFQAQARDPRRRRIELLAALSALWPSGFSLHRQVVVDVTGGES